MGKLTYIVKELVYLIRKERLFMLTFILLVLAAVAFFVYHVTPITIATFIYAGI